MFVVCLFFIIFFCPIIHNASSECFTQKRQLYMRHMSKSVDSALSSSLKQKIRIWIHFLGVDSVYFFSSGLISPIFIRNKVITRTKNVSWSNTNKSYQLTQIFFLISCFLLIWVYYWVTVHRNTFWSLYTIYGAQYLLTNVNSYF